MKNWLTYLFFVLLVIYHLLTKTSWTPALYYTGTYGVLVSLLIMKFIDTKKANTKRAIGNKKPSLNWLLLAIYFTGIYLYAMFALDKDYKVFLENISLRTWALGIGGVAIVLLMLIRREE